MNLEQLQRKLLAAARANLPRDHVPYAFEKRIMARLGDAPPLDLGTLWARALWRAATPCLAVMLLLAAWSFVGSEFSVANAGTTPAFDQQFEQVLLAGIESGEETW